MSKPSDSTGGQYSDVGKRSTLSTASNTAATNQQRKPTTPVAAASTVKQTGLSIKIIEMFMLMLVSS
jgi:hypothetical protein